MVYFVELWNAKPEWLALSVDERVNYMNNIGPHIQSLVEKGTKVITWTENDPSTEHKSSHDYFAIWSFPDQETADGFQQLVEGAGWYNYFEQVNAMGAEGSAESVIERLIRL